MKQYIVAYFAALVPLLIIDFGWLSIMLKRFYAPHLHQIMRSSPDVKYALLFYLLYAAGIALLVLIPGQKLQLSLLEVTLNGALLGFMAYSAYDLTNQATIQGWPLIVTLVDMAWGTILTAATASIAYLIVARFS